MAETAEAEDGDAGAEAKDFGLWAGGEAVVVVAERLRQGLGVMGNDVGIDRSDQIARIEQIVFDVPREITEEHEAEFAVLHEDADRLSVFGVVVGASNDAIASGVWLSGTRKWLGEHFPIGAEDSNVDAFD